MYNEREVLKADELDIVSHLFGIRIIKRPPHQDDVIELYVEDDESYHYKMSFSAYWLSDLIKCAELAEQRASCSYE